MYLNISVKPVTLGVPPMGTTSLPYPNPQFTLPKPPVYPTQTQMATLGGRYLSTEVYPFSFIEFLSYSQVPFDELSLTATESKALFMRADEQTREREISALTKLPNIHPCKRRIVITYDEEASIADKHGTIEVMPCWKWLIG